MPWGVGQAGFASPKQSSVACRFPFHCPYRIFTCSLVAPEIAGGDIYHYSQSSLMVAHCVYPLPSTFRVPCVRLPGSRGRTLLATHPTYIRHVYVASLLVLVFGFGHTTEVGGGVLASASHCWCVRGRLVAQLAVTAPLGTGRQTPFAPHCGGAANAIKRCLSWLCTAPHGVRRSSCIGCVGCSGKRSSGLSENTRACC